jgi:DNA (cytosine-5)-methyltransferase 1
MRHGSLFSGIGGFDLASEWMGWENIFHCEWMEFPRKVLEYHFPESDSLIDICKTDFKKYANKIDILTGGFPCQPFSMAGKRKGTEDERYLWGEMLRAIQEIKPKYVIAENVFGITNIDGGMVFEQVCIDLETEGYEVQPFIIPAAAKNAPHRRDRVWFIAYANRNDGRSTNRKSGCEESKANRKGEQSFYFRTWTTSNEGNATNPNCNGFDQCNGNNEKHTGERRINAQCNIEQSVIDGNATNTECERLEGYDRERERCTEHRRDEGLFIGSETKFNASNTNGIRSVQRNSNLIGKLSERNGFETLCQPTNWQNFPTQSPICGGDDGLPTKLDGITFPKWRAESIKGYGNAIVPQVAYEIFKIIEKL